MRSWALILVAFCFNLLAADVVHHPAPKQPIYVSADWYPQLKQQLTPPPALGTPAQRQDESELREFQKNRTAAECETAKKEILVSLDAFFGTPAGLLPKNNIQSLSPFFEQVRNDGDFFVQKLKKDFPRQRPFLYLTGLEPCVAREVTGAYPSGHAVLSRLYSLILIDIYPAQKSGIEKRAQEIADHRVMVGMHHRSDIEAGQKLGTLIYQQMKQTPKFQADYKKIVTSVVTAD